jgi:hypothetical protein
VIHKRPTQDTQQYTRIYKRPTPSVGGDPKTHTIFPPLGCRASAAAWSVIYRLYIGYSYIYRYVYKTHSIFRPLGCRASAAAGAKRCVSVYIGLYRCIYRLYIGIYRYEASTWSATDESVHMRIHLYIHISVYIGIYRCIYRYEASTWSAEPTAASPTRVFTCGYIFTYIYR